MSIGNPPSTLGVERDRETGAPTAASAGPARIWPYYSDETIERAACRIRAGDLSATGVDADVAACEAILRRVLAPGREAFLCGSGTAALGSAYFALDLEPGTEVLVPTHTFRATVTPLLRQGLQPVLCDTDPLTGGIDLADAAARVTPRTGAIVVTHVWGRPVDLGAARSFADRHGLWLVEDCSHAHGVRWRDQPVGAAADVAVFSLGTTKLVTGGLAGAVVTSSRLVERALLWGQPRDRALAGARDPRLRALAVTGLGNNLRPSPIAAILVADHLERLPRTIAVKNANLEALGRLLADLLPELTPLPVAADRAAGTLYKFHCRWSGDPRDLPAVVDTLAGVGMRVRRPVPGLHWTPMFRADGYRATDEFLANLIEFDTRDLYEPAEGLLAGWRVALGRAVGREQRRNRTSL